MTAKVKRYIELGDYLYDDTPEDEYDKACAESKQLKSEMTLKELESLKDHVTAREYALGILPLIKAKQGVK